MEPLEMEKNSAELNGTLAKVLEYSFDKQIKDEINTLTEDYTRQVGETLDEIGEWLSQDEKRKDLSLGKTYSKYKAIARLIDLYADSMIVENFLKVQEGKLPKTGTDE